MKWILDTNDETDHTSEYKLTLSTGTAETEVTRIVTAHFAYPLHLTVIVDKQTVLEKTGHPNDKILIRKYPCKEGYYIKNYKASGACYIDSNGDGTYDFGFTKQDIVLTAVTKPISYKITFEKNGDNVDKFMGDKTMAYDKADNLPNIYYERPGYQFVGWNTKPDGSGTAYANKEKVKNLTSTAGETIHLYAQWKPVPSDTVASIFSEGTLVIYIGSALVFISVTAAIMYSAGKKKRRRDEGKEESP